jgi:hypothetical protein
MARTGLFGGFAFDEEVFTHMMQESDYWNNPIMASGIVHNDSSIMDAIGAKGNVATIPMYNPLNIYDENMEPLNNDGDTDNVPVEIKGNKQTCMMVQRMKAFKAKDFVKELTGADPISNVKGKIQDYYTQVWERELMNIAAAIMGVAELAEHVTDLSVTTGTIGAANNVDATTMIDAEQAALGDMAGKMGLSIMHSRVFANYKKQQLIEYDKFTVPGAISKEVVLPHINGKIVLVTDYHTVDNAVPGFPVYKTWLFGEGAFLTCDKNNYEKQYTTNYDPEKAAGTDMFYTKQGKVLHPNGLSLAVDNIAKESPTFAELGKGSNWALKFNHKNVRIGLIKSNG